MTHRNGEHHGEAAAGTPAESDTGEEAGRPTGRSGSTEGGGGAPHEEHSARHEEAGKEPGGGGPVSGPVPAPGQGRHRGRAEAEAAPVPPLPGALSGARTEVALRGSVELADALPYLLGYRPDDSIVVVALQGERARFGGRIRIGIPAAAGEWEALAAQVAFCVERLGDARGERPEGAVVYLCREPARGGIPEAVVEELRPLAQTLRTACGERDIPVFEALCLSAGRVWSYCCPDPGQCKDEGRRIATPGTSVMAAAAAYAGYQVCGDQQEMERRLTALGPPVAEAQERALDSSDAALVPRMLCPDDEAAVRHETLTMAEELLSRFRRSEPDPAVGAEYADAHDDALLDHAEAAAMILGLQDRKTRDRAAEWMEGLDVGPALRLWRALARRCVGPYSEHAAAPLTLAGWVAWSGGDEPTARVALVRALRTDPEYLFAQLLHRACNDGLDPELLRRCMREEQAARRSVPPEAAPPQLPGQVP